MVKIFRGMVVLLLTFVFVGCAMDRNQQGAESRPTPANIRNPVTEVPSKYVERERIHRVGTPISPTPPGPTNPTPNIPKRSESNNNRFDYNVRAADLIVQDITKMPEVERATAIQMGQSVYVGVVLREKEQLTDSLKQKIANRARRADSGLRKVYVSANPDFNKQLGQYADQVRAGRPVQGMINQLQDLFKRTFPEAK